jgi:anti-anti-sigma regulatory factor
MDRAVNVVDCAVEELLSCQIDPHTLVLQPIGYLDRTNYREFQILLGMALEQAVSGVIVDCLWVEMMDEYGIQTLVSGIERAAKLGKTISFAAMNHSIRIAMEAEWDRQRDMRFGSWQDLFGSDLEQFLDEQLPA